MPVTKSSRIFKVRGTEILATDAPERYRQKLARIALDEMYQFVAVLDPAGTLLEVNRAALEGGGLALSDVEGKSFWNCFWWTVSAETQATLKAAVARAAEGEFIRYDAEVYGQAHGKETIVIDFSMIPVKDEAGNVVFIVPEGRDITEKKAYEREIAAKNRDLQALLERIRELDEIKTQFFANVSHELRTPLALIIGPADRLTRQDSNLSSDQRQESARVIARNARMLLKHVNDLLDISKLEAGKLKVELREADVASLVRLMTSHFDILANDRGLAFLVETPASLVCAVDAEKLQRVVMNLLSNAFKFVPNGGSVRVRVSLDGKALRLSVDDSGPGVKPELRRAIFERFRQGDGGTNRQFGGTGLGLAIVKEFVEMHRGTLEVSDSELGGASFRVTLPFDLVAPDDRAAPPPAPSLDRSMVEGFIEELRPVSVRPDAIAASASALGVKPTVLVVEDNVEMNRFICECLANEYEVVAAFDGEEGLKLALAAHPVLIVTDLMMPKVSGVQMVAEIRLCAALAEIPILILSAKADEELKVTLLEEGAQDFIAKPFSEKDLLVRVRNLLRLKKSQERFRTLFESMERQVSERTASLKEAVAQMEEFSYSVSHDLRAPMRAMQSYAEALLQDYGDRMDETGNDFLRRIIAAATRMDRLTSDVLTYSRLARTRMPIETVALDRLMAELVRNYPQMQPPRAEVNVGSPLHPVLGYEPVLMQAVSNLMVNAVKFVAEGTRPKVQVWTEIRDGQVRLWIEDNGIGIEPAHQRRIFGMFEQVHAKGRFEGTGIGLAIVRKAIERMGGAVGFESDGRTGSKFWVQLPAARD